MRKDVYIDLHIHLDGAITADIAKKLAAVQHMELPTDGDKALAKLLSVPADCRSLNDFLKCFALPLSLLQTREGIVGAVRMVQENVKRQGVVYAEIRFAPQLHTEKGLTQRQVIEAALEGLEQSDIPCSLILCCMRGAGNRKANLETVELAREFLRESSGVAALDLAGAEAVFPTRDYMDIFKLAKSYGIPFTIHAGEADGPESAACAVEMGASRIGHGVRIYQDKKLMELVRDRGIPLEMCPTSNRQTKAVEDMRLYPLKTYLDMGIKATVNTDDMAISGTTMADEFQYVTDQLGISEAQKERLLLNAAEAAFTDRKTKEYLKNLIWNGRSETEEL
ncbi:adenosine deaminase [Clostridium sp. AM58-1XD]|uniref:adenosine deaminase n=1 Tax=Clostridium sp. AM58-1XD TaxID=2292307 RepID=UPI000E4C4330|nr:adenosine deaminase [Clostridium sp. AM58-1XD]RGY98744.1 adenosine deaminase [Clostridium sp. AM58-1XD]